MEEIEKLRVRAQLPIRDAHWVRIPAAPDGRDSGIGASEERGFHVKRDTVF